MVVGGRAVGPQSVGPSPTSAKLIRAARRLATSLRAEWIALYVETPSQLNLPQAQRDRVIQHLRLGGSNMGLHRLNG